MNNNNSSSYSGNKRGGGRGRGRGNRGGGGRGRGRGNRGGRGGRGRKNIRGAKGRGGGRGCATTATNHHFTIITPPQDSTPNTNTSTSGSTNENESPSHNPSEHQNESLPIAPPLQPPPPIQEENDTCHTPAPPPPGATTNESIIIESTNVVTSTTSISNRNSWQSLSPPPPAPYFMCSQAECEERQSSGEISIFESQWPPPPTTTTPPPPSSSSSNNPRNNNQNNKQKKKSLSRYVDPRFAMTKYRRSAAGMDTKNRTPPRSLQQLMCCLDQLEYILCYQQQPTTFNQDDNNNSPNPHPFPKQTLIGTVSFVEDRIRAIQVDMVVTQKPSATLQYRIVKCHVLILFFLMGDNNNKGYETKFGHQALTTALTNYWDDDVQSSSMDDEILCFMALQQLCQYYLNNNSNSGNDDNDESSLSYILGYYRNHVTAVVGNSNNDPTTGESRRRRQRRSKKLSDYPKFQWALHLVHLAIMGRPRSILRQLVEIGQQQQTQQQEVGQEEKNSGVGVDGDVHDVSDSFAILCRCCVGPIIDILRYQTLDQYNKSYMKGEKVTTTELARLLYFHSPKEAGDFAETMAGLTRNRTTDDNDDDDNNDKIVFKIGPIQKNDKLGLVRPDGFVFGSHYNHDKWFGSKTLLLQKKKDAWDDIDEDHPEPITVSPTSVADNNTTAATKPDSNRDILIEAATTDADGVLVPPASLLYKIIRG